MSPPSPLTSSFLARLRNSLERLVDIGLLARYEIGPGPDDLTIELSDDGRQLWAAGLRPLDDPTFLGLLAAHAPDGELRAWLERRAADVRAVPDASQSDAVRRPNEADR